MKPGDRVSFLQSYGNPVLRIFGDEYRYVYRKRRVMGTVERVLMGEGFPPSVTIKVDGAAQYSGLVGMPVSKVRSEVPR